MRDKEEKEIKELRKKLSQLEKLHQKTKKKPYNDRFGTRSALSLWKEQVRLQTTAKKQLNCDSDVENLEKELSASVMEVHKSQIKLRKLSKQCDRD